MTIRNSYSEIEIRMQANEFLCNPDKTTQLETILENENIRYREADLGVDGQGEVILGACKTQGLKKFIVVSNSISANEGRKRFTLAHEIGHIFLHHGSKLCVATDFALLGDKRLKEYEANAFASELLLPYNNMLQIVGKADLSFAMIESTAKLYKTSLYATSIRLVKLDKGASAVVLHDGRRIKWAALSPSCRKDICKDVLGEHTIYQRLNKNTLTWRSEVDASIWFGGDTEGLICIEEVYYFTKLRKYLSIINLYEE